MKAVSVIGVPMQAGQPKKGTQFGPEAMRKHDLIHRLQRLGVTVEDTGDLDIPNPKDDPTVSNIKHPKAVGLGNKIVVPGLIPYMGRHYHRPKFHVKFASWHLFAHLFVSDAVEQELKKGNSVLVLGGDHSLGIGSVHGNILGEKERPIVLWVDAHSDINTSITSPSGNAHGMPVSFFLEETTSSVPKMPEFDWITAKLKAKDVVFIGLRDIDSGEVQLLQNLGIKYFSMHEVDAYGIKDVLRLALEMTDPTGKRPIHVSFDIDGMDPMFSPSTGTPVHGGLTFRECMYMAEILHATNRISVLDIVELNPTLGTEEDKEKTIMHTMKIIEHFYGNKRAGIVTSD